MEEYRVQYQADIYGESIKRLFTTIIQSKLTYICQPLLL